MNRSYNLHDTKDHPVFWLPMVLIALCYYTAKISPLAGAFILALALTPLMRKTLFRKRLVWEVMSLVFLFLLFVDISSFSRHVGVATTHLLCFLLISRTWVKPDPRIFGQRLVLSFVFWILIGAINNDVYYLYYSLFILPALISALLAYHAGLYQSTSPPQLRLGFWSLNITLVMLPLALVLFLIMPRYRLGYALSGQLPLSDSASGLGQSVNLDDITRIKADPSPAFKVSWISPDVLPRADFLYWRALIFDHFDGRTWSKTLPSRMRITSRGAYGPGIYTGWQANQNDPLATYRIEPYTFFPALVHIGHPLFIRFYGSRLAVSDAFELYHETHRPYAVISVIDRTETGRYRVPPLIYPQPPEPAYLQVPPNLRTLKKHIDSWIPDPLPSLQTAIRLESILRSRYQYTTEIYNLGESHPLIGFLEKRFAGHCEFFASSMAILLRLRGIPTRLVTGYRGGENLDDGTILVRQAMAHSWVEVWDPASRTWVGFDPTPAQPIEPAWWKRPFKSFQTIASKIEGWWDEQIVLYSSQTQWLYFQTIVSTLSQVRRNIRSFVRRTVSGIKNPDVHLHPLYGLIIPGILLLMAMARYYRRHRSTGTLMHPASKYLLDLMKSLEKTYGRREPSETWREYIQRVLNEDPRMIHQWNQILKLYYQLRYTNQTDEALYSHFRQWIRTFRQQIRTGRSVKTRGE